MKLSDALNMMGSRGGGDSSSPDTEDAAEEGMSADELIREGIYDLNKALKAETDKKRQASIQAVVDQATALLGE